MAFDITQVAIDGATLTIGNVSIVHDFVEGNVKQFSGGEWNQIGIPDKAKLRQIRIVGHVENDADKATLEGYRDENTYSYADGVVTLDRVAVMDLIFDHSSTPSTGHQRWGVTLILEEFSQ